jgi:hypothetical protein
MLISIDILDTTHGNIFLFQVDVFHSRHSLRGLSFSCALHNIHYILTVAAVYPWLSGGRTESNLANEIRHLSGRQTQKKCNSTNKIF